jgi:glycosyltransferase involved in cell wall biosynthesis
MKTSLVSIIVPTLNSGATLEKCLESLSKLKYPNFEVIIVDAGSTDGTKAISRKFPRFRFIEKKGCGRSEARNIAIRTSKGSYIATIDSDAVASSDWLGEAIKVLSKDEKIGAIGAPESIPKDEKLFSKSIGEVYEYTEKDTAIRGCNAVYRKKAIRSVGGYPKEVNYLEEEILHKRLMKSGWKLVLLPREKMVVYHYHRKNIYDLLRQNYETERYTRYSRNFGILDFLYGISLIIIPLAVAFAICKSVQKMVIKQRRPISKVPIYSLVYLIMILGRGCGFYAYLFDYLNRRAGISASV